MRAGKVHKAFKAKNGRRIILRTLGWEDLDDCVRFINRLVEERDAQSDLGIIADKKQSREEESEWLANLLVGVEKGDILSVAAEADGRIVANSEVTRGRYGDTKHHGSLGISVLKNYRGVGIGYEM